MSHLRIYTSTKELTIGRGEKKEHKTIQLTFSFSFRVINIQFTAGQNLLLSKKLCTNLNTVLAFFSGIGTVSKYVAWLMNSFIHN